MPAIRKSRAKVHLRWNEINAQYNFSLDPITVFLRSRYISLTITEARVLALVANQKSSIEIAEALRIEEHSVENYRSKARRKIGLHSEDNLRFFLKHLLDAR